MVFRVRDYFLLVVSLLVLPLVFSDVPYVPVGGSGGFCSDVNPVINLNVTIGNASGGDGNFSNFANYSFFANSSDFWNGINAFSGLNDTHFHDWSNITNKPLIINGTNGIDGLNGSGFYVNYSNVTGCTEGGINLTGYIFNSSGIDVNISIMLNDSILAYYKMDDEVGTNVQDYVASLYNLTSNDTIVNVSGLINSAHSYTDRLESVSTTDFFNGDGETKSVSVWVNLNESLYYGISSTQMYFFSQYTQGTLAWIGVQTALVCGTKDGGGTWQYAVYDNDLTEGIWYHIVCTFGNGSSTFLYVNGIAYENTTSVGDSVGNSYDVVFGSEIDGSNSMFGVIDEVGIWNRTLNQYEVDSLYNGGSGLGFDDFSNFTSNSSYSTSYYILNWSTVICNGLNGSGGDGNFNATDEIYINNINGNITLNETILNNTCTDIASANGGNLSFNQTLTDSLYAFAYNTSNLTVNHSNSSTFWAGIDELSDLTNTHLHSLSNITDTLFNSTDEVFINLINGNATLNETKFNISVEVLGNASFLRNDTLLNFVNISASNVSGLFFGNLTGNVSGETFIGGNLTAKNISVDKIVTSSTDLVSNLNSQYWNSILAGSMSDGGVCSYSSGIATISCSGSYLTNLSQMNFVNVSATNISAINFFGNLTGNVTGHIKGNLTGNVTGNVKGLLTGNVTGNLTGNISATLLSNLYANSKNLTTVNCITFTTGGMICSG